MYFEIRDYLLDDNSKRYSETNEWYYHRCHSCWLAQSVDLLNQHLVVQTRYNGSPVVVAAARRRSLSSQSHCSPNLSRPRLQPKPRAEVADLISGNLRSWQQTLKITKNANINLDRVKQFPFNEFPSNTQTSPKQIKFDNNRPLTTIKVD